MSIDRRPKSVTGGEAAARPAKPNPCVENRESEDERPSAGQLLFGAQEISQFLFGSTAHRRRVYHLADKHGLPVFHIGSTICARERHLAMWLDEKDGDAAENGGDPSSSPRCGP
jgi:hypothetical protein